jgi:ribokinase
MKVPRLPRSGETLLGSGYRVDYGGKGSNQAVGCARLGAAVNFIAKIGNDSFGDMALTLYREEGVDTAGVQRTPEAPTGVGFITVEVATGHNSIVLDPGANEHLSAADVQSFPDAFTSAAVVLTQLEIPVPAAEAALSLGRARHAMTILNPAPVRPLPPSILQLVDVLTPNETEARVLAGLPPEQTIEPMEVARKLIREGVKQVVITLGEKGALIVNASSSAHIPAIKVSAVDTTGAGDAFNAGLALALASGADLDAAVRFAVITGGLAVTREGVVPSLPTIERVVQVVVQQGQQPPVWLHNSVANVEHPGSRNRAS